MFIFLEGRAERGRLMFVEGRADISGGLGLIFLVGRADILWRVELIFLEGRADISGG